MMTLLQIARVSARQLERMLVAPLPTSKRRRKSRRRMHLSLSLLHQLDKKPLPVNQLHLVLHHHPLLLRQSKMLVSSKKLLLLKFPRKMIAKEIFPPL
jgi:hypothetical protein